MNDIDGIDSDDDDDNSCSDEEQRSKQKRGGGDGGGVFEYFEYQYETEKTQARGTR